MGTITVKNSSSFTNIVVDFADTNHEYFENGVHKYIEIRSTATGADFFLKAGQQLDYETLEDLQKLMFGINAKVTAQTSTGYTLSHVTPVNFEVTNANDYTTAKTEYALNVDEDAEVGSLLAGTIELSDVDSIKPVRVRMEFVGEGEDVSTHGSLFGFQQQDSSNPLVWNLVLLSGMDLDHEATATYNTTILAKILRNGYEGREQKLYFNVDITVNDAGIEAVAMPPNSDVQTPFIHASASIGDSAGSIRGTFGDRTVTYDLTADHYAIDSNTGEITLKSPFDGTDLIPTESDGRIFHTINVQMFANRGTTTETTTEPFTIEVNATTAVSIIALEKDGSDYKADNSDLSADRDGDTLSFKETTAITTREGNTVTGSYTVSGSGELVWTPDATFSGTALFGVTIKDSRGGEGTANVTAYVAPIVEVEITDNTGTIVGEGGHIDIAEAGDTVVENSSQPRTSLIVAGTTEAVRLGTITVKNSSSFTNIGVDFADTNHEYFENGVHKYIEIISTATGGELRLKAGQQLDYEALEDLQKLMFGINVKVRADISHDGGTTTNTVYSKVTPVNFEVTNANDYTTAKTQYALNVDEDAEVGSLVAGTIELSDVDSIKPSRIRMEFVGEGEDVITHGSLFGFQQQDSNNPLVWNLVLLSGMDLDHEDEEIYNTTILAKVLRNGYEGREQKLYFNVDITVNDAGIKSVAVPPNSDVQTLFIHASAAIGDSAGSISATFGDRTVTYDLTADHYRIDPNTGEITFKTAFDEADLEPTESDGRIFHTINVQMFANRGTTTETTTEPFRIEVNATTAPTTPITLEKDGSDYKADNSDLSADRDGDTLSFKETTAITTREGNTVTGSYTVSRSGELEWTPDATFSGIATFGVTIKDSRGGEGKVSVTVNVPDEIIRVSKTHTGGEGNDAFTLYQGKHATGEVNFDIILDFNRKHSTEADAERDVDRILVDTFGKNWGTYVKPTTATSKIEAFLGTLDITWVRGNYDGTTVAKFEATPTSSEPSTTLHPDTIIYKDDTAVMVLKGYTEDLTKKDFLFTNSKPDSANALPRPAYNPTDISSTPGRGFRLIDETGSGPIERGKSVGRLGDVNGDGIVDFLIGVAEVDSNGLRDNGVAYVVFGNLDGYPSTVNLGNLNGSDGFRIYGRESEGRLGINGSFIGDINHDGIDDFAVGVRRASNNGRESGSVYFIYGQKNNSDGTSGFDLSSTGVLNLDSITSTSDRSKGFRVDGPQVRFKAHPAYFLGDVNGDGIDDALVMVPISYLGGDNEPTSYILLGRNVGTSNVRDFPATIDLGNISGMGIIPVKRGAANDGSSFAATSIGDLNSDGYDDFVVGAYSNSKNGFSSGAAYVVLGDNTVGTPSRNEIRPAEFNGDNGFVIYGANAWDYFGMSVAGISDFNGDDIPDIIVAAKYANNNGRHKSGSVYIIFGEKHDSYQTSYEVSQLNQLGANNLKGVRIDGAQARDDFGYVIWSAGDFDGDGYGDVLASTDNTDKIYLIFGGNDLQGIIDLAGASNGRWIKFDGVGTDYHWSMRKISSAGDLNDDGLTDIVLGSSENDNYIIYGQARGIKVSRVRDETTNKYDTLEVSSAGGDNVQYFWKTYEDTDGDSTPDVTTIIASTGKERTYTPTEGATKMRVQAVFTDYNGEIASLQTEAFSFTVDDAGTISELVIVPDII